MIGWSPLHSSELLEMPVPSFAFYYDRTQSSESRISRRCHSTQSRRFLQIPLTSIDVVLRCFSTTSVQFSVQCWAWGRCPIAHPAYAPCLQASQHSQVDAIYRQRQALSTTHDWKGGCQGGCELLAFSTPPRACQRSMRLLSLRMTVAAQYQEASSCQVGQI